MPAIRRHARAFSLLELVMMLGILAVMAAIAAPRYANSLARYRCQVAAQRVASDLNWARSRARTTSLGQSIVFDIPSAAYRLPGAVTSPGSASPYVVNLSAEPYAATVVAVDFAGVTTVSFDRYGQPSAGGTVTVRSGVATATVALDATTGLASVL